MDIRQLLEKAPDALGLKELEREFQDAEMPDIAEMEGEFHVDLEPNPLGEFRPAKQKKVLEGKSGQGHMSALGAVEFGHFDIAPGRARDGSGPCVEFIYDKPQNPFFLRGVVDEVRKVGSDRYLGKLYLNALGRSTFIFYFSMTRA